MAVVRRPRGGSHGPSGPFRRYCFSWGRRRPPGRRPGSSLPSARGRAGEAFPGWWGRSSVWLTPGGGAVWAPGRSGRFPGPGLGRRVRCCGRGQRRAGTRFSARMTHGEAGNNLLEGHASSYAPLARRRFTVCNGLVDRSVRMMY